MSSERAVNDLNLRASLQLLHLTFCPSSTCALLVGLDHPQLNREASVNMEGQVHEVGTLIVLDCQASVQGSGVPTALWLWDHVPTSFNFSFGAELFSDDNVD